MKNSHNYRITREEYRNEHGASADASFYVQQLKPFMLFWKRWFYIKHEECGWGDCCKVRTRFKSKYDAKCFIKDILCNDIKRQSYSRHIIGSYDCNTINKVE